MCQGGEGAWIASRKMILAVVVLTLAVTLSGGADAKAFAVHEGPGRDRNSLALNIVVRLREANY